jgi:hypothetical protein
MDVALKPGWSKPSTILLACEVPPEGKTFAFALAEAADFGADLIIFHAYGGLDLVASKNSTICGYNYATSPAQKRRLEPFA